MNQEFGKPSDRAVAHNRTNKTRDIVALFLIALTARLALFPFFARLDPTLLIVDEANYFELASNLLSGGGLFQMRDGQLLVASRTPGYPVFVAACVGLARSLSGLWLAQSLLGATTAVLSFKLAQHTLHRRRAWAVGLMVALYPWLIIKGYQALTFSLFVPLVLSFLLLWLRIERSSSVFRWFALGLLAGACTLIRPEFLLFPLFLFFVRFVRDRLCSTSSTFRGLAMQAVSLLVGMSVLILPWLVRNESKLDSMPTLQTNSGLHLLTGNYPDAPGDTFTHVIVGPDAPPSASFFEIERKAPEGELEQDEFFLNHALSSITNAPVDYATRGFRRLGFLFNVETREALAANIVLRRWELVPAGFYSFGATVLVFLSSLLLIILFAAAVPFADLTGRYVEFTLLIYQMALNFFLQGQAQYHLVLIPTFAITILAAHQGRRNSRMRQILSASLVLLVVANIVLNNEWNWWALAFPDFF